MYCYFIRILFTFLIVYIVSNLINLVILKIVIDVYNILYLTLLTGIVIIVVHKYTVIISELEKKSFVKYAHFLYLVYMINYLPRMCLNELDN